MVYVVLGWRVAMCIPPIASAVPSPPARAKRVTPCRELACLAESRTVGGSFLGNLLKNPPDDVAERESSRVDFPAG
jgi:hypothetical protein